MNEKLKNAYTLIKLKDFVAARPLILEVLDAQPQNVDAWWLSVFVAESQADKKYALQQVLRLNPEHGAARQMAHRLNLDLSLTKPQVGVHPQQTIPLSAPQKPRQQTNWGTRVLVILGVLSLSFAGAALFQGLTGNNILGFLFGEPEAVGGFVSEEEGGVAEDANGIPVTKVGTLHKGTLVLDTVLRGQAHSYEFVGRRGQELFILVGFSMELAGIDQEAFANSFVEAMTDIGEDGEMEAPTSDISAVEIWNSAGAVIARPTFSPARGAYTIQWTPPADGTYRLVIISREGAPAGQYFIQMDTFEGLSEDANALQNRR